MLSSRNPGSRNSDWLQASGSSQGDQYTTNSIVTSYHRLMKGWDWIWTPRKTHNCQGYKWRRKFNATLHSTTNSMTPHCAVSHQYYNVSNGHRVVFNSARRARKVGAAATSSLGDQPIFQQYITSLNQILVIYWFGRCTEDMLVHCSRVAYNASVPTDRMSNNILSQNTFLITLSHESPFLKMNARTATPPWG